MFLLGIFLLYIEDGASVPEIDSLAADAFLTLNPRFCPTKKPPSGGNVQRESRKVIQKSGRVPTGQVAVTGAGGRLQCQSVIHAVGPDANSRPHKECEQLLELVGKNVLRTAEAQGMVSIALPGHTLYT